MLHAGVHTAEVELVAPHLSHAAAKANALHLDCRLSILDSRLSTVDCRLSTCNAGKNKAHWLQLRGKSVGHAQLINGEEEEAAEDEKKIKLTKGSELLAVIVSAVSVSESES